MDASAPEASEQRELADLASSDFPHPYLAVDVVLLTVRHRALEVFLVLRENDEPTGWALPGAFVQADEHIDRAAARVVTEKIGLSKVPELRQLPAFGAPDRDPRRRVVSLPHVALIDPDRFRPGPARRAHSGVGTVEVGADLKPMVSVEGTRTRLVFDHEDMLARAIDELRRGIRLDDPAVYAQLLPKEFTLRQLQQVHEAVLGEPVNKDSFRRRVQTIGWLTDTGRREEDVEHRPAGLWTWRADVR